MIIFIDKQAFRDVFGCLFETPKNNDKECYNKISKKDIERASRKIEKQQQEKLKLEQYRKEYHKDPTSVMICPFGWSPFGIYL